MAHRCHRTQAGEALGEDQIDAFPEGTTIMPEMAVDPSRRGMGSASTAAPFERPGR